MYTRVTIIIVQVALSCLLVACMSTLFDSFNHVIDCLVAICEHDPIQAEQCATITHFNGSCIIKTGKFNDLLSYKNDLNQYDLDVEIV